MEEMNARTKLLIGEDQLQRLKTKKVAIFGIGGVGSAVCEALVRSGIEHFALIDHDTIEPSNINRQLIADTTTVGLKKVDVMKERILKINPHATVDCYPCFFLPEKETQIDFSSFDYVVDAVDVVTAKIALVVICERLHIPMISSMGTGNKLNPTLLEVADIYQTSVCPLARVMRYELKKRNIKNLKVVYSKEIPIRPSEQLFSEKKKPTPGSSSFVPPVAGFIIASEIIREFLTLKK